MTQTIGLVRSATVGLVRVSTSEQDTESQRHALAAWAGTRGVALHVVEEAGVSGAAKDRPILDGAVASLGRGDTLVVTSLDRIARDVVRLLLTLDALHAKGVVVISLREGLDFSSPIGRAMAGLIGVFAQLERDMIRSRIRGAIVRAPGEPTRSVFGKPWGRRPTPIAQEVWADVTRRRGLGESWQGIAAVTGIPASTLRRRVRGVKWALLD